MMVMNYVETLEKAAQKKFGDELLVVVAKRDIKEAETIEDGLLELRKIPKEFLEPNSISFSEDRPDESLSPEMKKKLHIRKMDPFIGTVALVPMKKGEQVTFSKITEPGVRTGLAPQITPGKRGISIPVDETRGVSKLVKPGDRVDVIAILDLGGGKENRIAKTLLQDVVVLSVGRNVTNNPARLVELDGKKEKVKALSTDTNFSSVTLEVDPGQAQTLALVMGAGENSLLLSLRNNDDQERANYNSTMLSDIVGADANRGNRGLASPQFPRR
jgi:pilus assembly protein CpaB